MSCRPTVGEVREHDGRRCPVTSLFLGTYWMSGGDAHVIRDCKSRIVIVAPENRARVTAGPDWMGRV